MRRLVLLFLVVSSLQSFGQVLSGTYYIPKVNNQNGFNTLAQAFYAVNANGCSGEVVFVIQDNLHEIGDSLVLERSDLNSINKLLIKPAPDKFPYIHISGCASSVYAISRYSGLTFNNTGHVTIDGSNSEGSAAQHLQILLDDPTNGRNCIQLYGDCDNIVIKNAYIGSERFESSNSSAIYINGQDSGVSDYTVIDNCYIKGTPYINTYYGIQFAGAPSGLLFSKGITINKCHIFAKNSGITLNNIGHDSTETTISNNSIRLYGEGSKDNNTILINNWAGTVNIINNSLPDIVKLGWQRSSSVVKVSGGASNSKCNIFNNFIGGITTSVSTNATELITVFNLSDGAVYNIFNNSINRTSILPLTDYNEYSCLHLNGQNTKVNFKNNIVLNNGSSSKGINTCYSVISGTLVSDHNNIFYTDSNLVSIGYYNSSAYYTLASWVAGTNLDSNSISKKIYTESVSDLHLTKSSIGDFSLAGTYLPEVTMDIDCESRAGKMYPYMGADENGLITLAPYSKNIDADTSDWIGQKSSIIHGTAFDKYESIYTGEKDDARIDQSYGSNTYKNNDITEVRTLIDSNYIYFLFKLNDLININYVYIAVTFNYEMSNSEPVWIGDDSPVVLNPATNRGWERQIAIHCTSTDNLDIEQTASGALFAPFTNYATSYSLENNVIEARISLYDLVLQPGQSFITTISTFHNNVLLAGNGDATYKSYVDAVTPDYNGSSNVFYRVGGHEYFNTNVDWTNPGVVPVELQSFEVEQVDSHIGIAWTTATETNCSYFEIQKSTDKVSWNKLDRIEGMGTSTEPHRYSIMDFTPNKGTNYYKLLQIDYDGTISYLGIKEVNFNGVYTYSLTQNYPNPFNPSTSIKFSIPSKENVTLKIFDILGREISTIVNEVMDSGNYELSWNAGTLSSGVYFYQLKAGNFCQTKKMILEK